MILGFAIYPEEVLDPLGNLGVVRDLFVSGEIETAERPLLLRRKRRGVEELRHGVRILWGTLVFTQASDDSGSEVDGVVSEGLEVGLYDGASGERRSHGCPERRSGGEHVLSEIVEVSIQGWEW